MNIMLSMTLSLFFAVAGAMAGQTEVAESTRRQSGKNPIQISGEMDPEVGVYGLPWGAAVEDAVSTFGTPTGRVALRGLAEGLVYGRSHVLVFRNGLLEEVHIVTRLFDWDFRELIDPHPHFDSEAVGVRPGIALGAKISDIEKHLPGIKEGKYEYVYKGTNFSMIISYSIHENSRGEQRLVSGIKISSDEVEAN